MKFTMLKLLITKKGKKLSFQFPLEIIIALIALLLIITWKIWILILLLLLVIKKVTPTQVRKSPLTFWSLYQGISGFSLDFKSKKSNVEISFNNQGLVPKENKVANEFIHIIIPLNDEDNKDDRVNIRIPLQLLSAGIKIGRFMPNNIKAKVNDALAERGINIDTKSTEQLKELLQDLSIDIEEKEGRAVRIYCN